MSDLGSYIGRFAPSPTGPLHFGSLLAAVASYLDARANSGTWLIRMEDLDPAREPPGTDRIILDQLADYGMQSDQPVLYQSERLDAYSRALEELRARGFCFACSCSRKRVRDMGSVYDGTCRNRKTPPTGKFSIRVRTNPDTIEFMDLIQGLQVHQLDTETGDFIIKRKDGLFAYQLAVVVDDAYQQVSHVVRGHDLMESTPRQIYLQNLFGFVTPIYAHVPVVINELGQKLSKQHFAESVSKSERCRTLFSTLPFLGLDPPGSLARESVASQLEWAVSHWDIHSVPKLATIPQQRQPSG